MIISFIPVNFEKTAALQKAICDFRLDFETFTTNGPALTDEAANAHPCQDITTLTNSAVV